MTDMMWFRHDILSMSDDKIQVLIAEGGFTAYGFYWAIIEAMYKAEGAIPEMTINALAHAAHLKKSEKEKFQSLLVTIGLISFSENKMYFSERVEESIVEAREYQKKRSEHGKMMNSVRWGDNFGNKRRSKQSSYKDACSIPTASCKDTDSIPTASLKGPTDTDTEEYKELLTDVSSKKNPARSLEADASDAHLPTTAIKHTGLFLNLKNSRVEVDGDWLDRKKKLFPEMDVESEMRKAISWLDDNPQKRPASNWKSFAGGWLNRSWDDLRKGIKSNTKNLNYGRVTTSNADWIGQKGGRIELD